MRHATNSHPTRHLNKFGPGRDGFANGDPIAGVPSTDLEAEWFDAIQEEIAAVAEFGGIPLNPNDNKQLLQAIQRIYQLQKQQTPNDTTDGRLLTVGKAFGLGAVNHLGQVDLDSVLTSQIASQWNSAWATIDKHYPVAGISGTGSLVVVASGNGDIVTQQYTTFSDAQTYTRSCSLGTWKPWRRAVTLDDFTGANQQLQPNGFQRVPGGLLLQCGSVTVAANNAPTVINLPIPWPVGGMIPICSPGGLVASAVSCGCAITGISQLTLWQSGTNPITVVYHVWGR